jgi:hypothetical protein
MNAEDLPLRQKRDDSVQVFTIYQEKDLNRTITNNKSLVFDMSLLEEEYDYETDEN